MVKTAPADCLCNTDSGLLARGSTTATFVHGTWGKHGEWMHRSADLPRELRKSGAIPRGFCWSGKNSHRGRLGAARELEDDLLQVIEQAPNTSHSVIAHSHGGTIAAYAICRNEVLRERINLVTLGTPFIQARERRLPRRLALSMTATLILLGFLVIVAAFVPDGRNWAWYVAVTIFALGLAWPVMLLMSFLRYPVEEHALRTLVGNAGAAQRQAEINRIATPMADPGRFLVVRSTGDEASGALIASQFFGWLFTRLLNGVDPDRWNRIWNRVAWIYTIGFAVGWVMRADFIEAAALALISLVGVAMCIAAIISLASLPLMAATQIGFGFDSIWLSAHAQVTAEAIPRGSPEVCLLHAAPPGGEQLEENEEERNTDKAPLAHSVYDHPEVAGVILDWLGRRATEAPVELQS